MNYTKSTINENNNADSTFELEIKSNGEIISVSKNESILDALEDNGYFIPAVCDEGRCGTCITGLLGGEADHRDTFMTKAEKAKMNKITPCCSRAISPRLILDI